jgi:hypothetical protein
MAIKNNKSIDIETLKNQLEKDFSDYNYEINKNALTVGLNEDTKINIVAINEEFWVIEAVPVNFKMLTTVIIITIFAYWVQMQDWNWMINVGLYFVAFIALGYITNYLYGLLYRNKFKNFKPVLIQKIKELVE